MSQMNLAHFEYAGKRDRVSSYVSYATKILCQLTCVVVRSPSAEGDSAIMQQPSDVEKPSYALPSSF